MRSGRSESMCFGESRFEDRDTLVEFFSVGQDESIISAIPRCDSPPILSRLHLSIRTDCRTSSLLACRQLQYWSETYKRCMAIHENISASACWSAMLASCYSPLALVTGHARPDGFDPLTTSPSNRYSSRWSRNRHLGHGYWECG
jgi:hypothetical protein